MTTINPAFITLAQNYLATKERTPHMRFEAFLTAVRQMAGATCDHSLRRR